MKLEDLHQKWHHDHRRLSPKEKKAVHFFVMAVIAISLLTEGAKLADWNFLLLSVMVELS